MKRFRIRLVPVLTCGDRAKMLKRGGEYANSECPTWGTSPPLQHAAGLVSIGGGEHAYEEIHSRFINFIQDFFSGGRGRTPLIH